MTEKLSLRDVMDNVTKAVINFTPYPERFRFKSFGNMLDGSTGWRYAINVEDIESGEEYIIDLPMYDKMELYHVGVFYPHTAGFQVKDYLDEECLYAGSEYDAKMQYLKRHTFTDERYLNKIEVKKVELGI